MGLYKYKYQILLFLILPSVSFAGAWTLPKGTFSVRSSIIYQSTDSRFCTAEDAKINQGFRDLGCTSAGHSTAFDPLTGGEIEALVIYNEFVYGLTGWLDLGLEFPFNRLQFTNLVNPNRPATSGIGDIRFYGKLRLTENPFVSSLILKAKSPTGDFTLDAEVVNVSEGQWDFTVATEIGKSLWPLPGYVNMGFGYRFRQDNPNFEYTFGNEFIALFEAGININKTIMVKGSADWLLGQRPTLRVTGQELLWRRELLTLVPALIFSPSKRFQFETAVVFPLRGEDFPDGPQYIGKITYNLSFLN
jgi:hypothetical protein